jgi:hypothetical protein
MNECELLELAAKAARIDLVWDVSRRVCWLASSIKNTAPTAWNPLADDGDALRLVVRLRELGTWTAEATKPINCDGWAVNPYAATRRAIVRAAAEIGKAE